MAVYYALSLHSLQENWTWNGVKQSRVRATEISFMREACGVSRWDRLSNEGVYERCGMRGHGSGDGVWCGGVCEKEHPEMVWPY